MAIRNMYEVVKREEPALLHRAENPNFAIHHINLPFRAVIVASSGSGKTNFLLNMISLFSQGKGTFSKIFITTKDADEPLYNFLKKKSDSIIISEGMSTLPKLDSKTFDKKENSLVVIDDLVLSKNMDSVCDYYVRCRKLGVSVIFISQSFFKIPKIIRGNCSLVILLKMSGQRDCNLILSEFGLGVSKQQLIDLYEHATAEKFSALVVDLEADKAHRFRKNFDEFLPV
jgi:hypothetical protein